MRINGKEYFSASQLGLWGDCHLHWYLKKIKGYIEPGKTSPFLIRGRIVHEVLENVDDFKIVDKTVTEHKDFNKMDDKFKEETINIMKLFVHNNQLPSPPVKSEMEIINHELEMVAYLDVVGEDYIVDYKTSRFWNSVPDNYWWQLKIYALLYYLETGKFIRYLGVYYVKYGRIEWLTIEEHELANIKQVIIDAIADIRAHLKAGDFKCTHEGKYKCKCGELIPKP